MPPIDDRKASTHSLPPIDSMKSNSANNLYSGESIEPTNPTKKIKVDNYTFPPLPPNENLSAEEVKFRHKDSILKNENDQLQREIESLLKATEDANQSIDRLKFERRLLLGAILSQDQTAVNRAYDYSSDESSIVIIVN